MENTTPCPLQNLKGGPVDHLDLSLRENPESRPPLVHKINPHDRPSPPLPPTDGPKAGAHAPAPLPYALKQLLADK